MSELQTNESLSIERIIAKIDNDFNPDNSDWIPRVAAWCLDAMSQLKCTKTERKRKRVKVTDRIAYSETDLNGDFKVYDNNGCRVKEYDGASSTACGGTTRDEEQHPRKGEMLHHVTPNTIEDVLTGRGPSANYVKADTINDKYPYRYNVHHFFYGRPPIKERNYVKTDNNKLELNFDADYVEIETEYVASEYSEKYGCEMPTIPNNGKLIEAITMFCMYKMLCRGYRHQIMSLAQSDGGTNPYRVWMQMKDEVERDTLIDDQTDDDLDDASRVMRSGMVIEMFDGRR